MPIIINSKSCSDAGWWSKHLQKAETNERVEIVGFYGLSAETIEDAFSEMRVMAQGSKAQNYFSQYNINPRADEQLTEAQWEEAHDLHRKNHGLDHLPYFRVRHIKEGRVHEHGIALRVDPETCKAIPDSLTAAINERTSRELEIRFDLQRGRSVLTANREFERPERRPKKRETFREGERKVDVEIVKADAQAARQQADNGQSFKAALEASGAYVLARGDRRDFVIIDRAGEAHSLAKRLGMKAAEMRAFMADLDPAGLPTAAQAKELQAERQAQRQYWDRDAAEREWQEKLEAAAVAPQPAPSAARESRQGQERRTAAETDRPAAEGRYAPLQPPQQAPEKKHGRSGAAQVKTAWRESTDANPAKDAAALHAAMLAQGIALARVSHDEAYASERRAAFAKAAGSTARALREGEIVAVTGRGQVYRLTERTTGDDKAIIAGRLAGLEGEQLPDLAHAQEAARDAGRAAWQQRKDAERAAARRDAPVAGAAAEIRLAWSLSRTASDLEDALAARGMSFAHVTAAEAEASKQDAERRRQAKAATARGPYADLATDPGRFAPELTEGEIVVVTGRGDAYRLDERTTGQMRPEIEGRLAGIDRAALMDVAATQEAMRAASLEAWKAERRAEREQARPASWIEDRIAACATDAPAAVAMDEQGRIAGRAEALGDRLKNEDERQLHAATVYGAAAFFARLDDAGIAIVRVTAADERALHALRRDEEMKARAAEANRESYQGNRFADVLPGDLAAVTRQGDVYRINPDKLGDAARFIPENLPGVIEARDRFASERHDIAAHWELKQAEIEHNRAQRESARETRRPAATAKHAAVEAIETPAAAAGKAIDSGLTITGKLARAFTQLFSIFSFGGMAEPKKTAQQMRDEAQAAGNVEMRQAEAYARHVQAKEAAHDWQAHDLKTAQQEKDVRLARILGTNPTAEANINRDPYERQREQERERER